MIDVTEFDKVEVRVGTVVSVVENKKARHPAYAVAIDFGPEIGLKKSSAQITALYTPDDLVGTQVVCCVNLQPMHIGSVKSEVRILRPGCRPPAPHPPREERRPRLLAHHTVYNHSNETTNCPKEYTF